MLADAAGALAFAALVVGAVAAGSAVSLVRWTRRLGARIGIDRVRRARARREPPVVVRGAAGTPVVPTRTHA